MKTKRKFLARLVLINDQDSLFYKKRVVGVDTDFYYNGVICRRDIVDKDVIIVDPHNLKLMQISYYL